eukprot:scaffold107727_cov69-Phaeocystis_antarctica.AAC.2
MCDACAHGSCGIGRADDDELGARLSQEATRHHVEAARAYERVVGAGEDVEALDRVVEHLARRRVGCGWRIHAAGQRSEREARRATKHDARRVDGAPHGEAERRTRAAQRAQDGAAGHLEERAVAFEADAKVEPAARRRQPLGTRPAHLAPRTSCHV